MGLKDIFRITRSTKVVMAITASVAFLAFFFAFFYYWSINKYEDPRTEVARKLLLQYDNTSSSLNNFNTFRLLDSALIIYNSFPDYNGSFETGVIYNNKCSSLLLTAIYDSTLTIHEKEATLGLALEFSDKSISCYRKWNHEWGLLTKNEIRQKMDTLIDDKNPAFGKISFIKVFERRVKNILMAQIETERRLSVSLTNRGMIYRHLNRQDSALVYYRKALELWKDNRIAKSNMNVLMGGEPVKATLIESLFPPDKKKR